MEANIDMEEALISLGYGRKEAREAVSKVESTTAKFEDRLKEALKNISGK